MVSEERFAGRTNENGPRFGALAGRLLTAWRLARKLSGSIVKEVADGASGGKPGARHATGSQRWQRFAFTWDGEGGAHRGIQPAASTWTPAFSFGRARNPST